MASEKAGKPEFMPFFGERFFHGCDSAGLTGNQERLYLRLIWLQWERGGERLPDDMKWLRIALASLGLKAWSEAAISGMVDDLVRLQKMHRRDGMIWNRQVEQRVATHVKIAVAKHERAQAAAGKRWQVQQQKFNFAGTRPAGVSPKHAARISDPILERVRASMGRRKPPGTVEN